MLSECSQTRAKSTCVHLSTWMFGLLVYESCSYNLWIILIPTPHLLVYWFFTTLYLTVLSFYSFLYLSLRTTVKLSQSLYPFLSIPFLHPFLYKTRSIHSIILYQFIHSILHISLYPTVQPLFHWSIRLYLIPSNNLSFPSTVPLHKTDHGTLHHLSTESSIYFSALPS